jgi:hypothetical protein
VIGAATIEGNNMIDFENTFVEELSVKLTQQEKLERAERAAAIGTAHRKKEQELKAAQKRGKLALESMKTEHQLLERAVHTGQEVRLVDCIYRANLILERLETVRIDTGEVVRSRALTKDELAAATQEPLRFPERHYEERERVTKPANPRKSAEELAVVVRDRPLEEPAHDEDGVVEEEGEPPAPNTPEPIAISSDGMPDGNMPRQFELPADDEPTAVGADDDEDYYEEDDDE